MNGHEGIIMASIHRVRVGKQGRIVLPKEIRETYGIDVGDEAVILAKGEELRLRISKISDDPLQDLIELSKNVSIGLPAKELKRKADEERLKEFLTR